MTSSFLTNSIFRNRQMILELLTETISNEKTYIIAGRITSVRNMSKVVFFDVEDQSASLQAALLKGGVFDEKQLKIGNIVLLSGHLMKTRTGELTLKILNTPSILSKCHQFLPDKRKKVQDSQIIIEKRYLDLMVNSLSRQNLIKRSQVIRIIRQFLEENGFIEVDTPILQHRPTVGTATPFVTKSDYLDKDFYLRGTCEIYLKQLCVSGFERIYEIGKVFRNESTSLIEFTLLEIICAYANYEDMMILLESLIKTIFKELEIKSPVLIEEKSVEIDSNWKKITLSKLLNNYLGVDIFSIEINELQKIAKNNLITINSDNTQYFRASLAQQVLKKYITPSLVQPTFIINYPYITSPLAKESSDKQFSERGYLYIAGQRICEFVSEQTDHLLQKESFTLQDRLQMGGNVQHIHDDLIDALSFGCPAMGGVGLNINRLISLVIGSRRVNDITFFPLTTGLLPS